MARSGRLDKLIEYYKANGIEYEDRGHYVFARNVKPEMASNIQTAAYDNRTSSNPYANLPRPTPNEVYVGNDQKILSKTISALGSDGGGTTQTKLGKTVPTLFNPGPETLPGVPGDPKPETLPGVPGDITEGWFMLAVQMADGSTKYRKGNQTITVPAGETLRDYLIRNGMQPKGIARGNGFTTGTPSTTSSSIPSGYMGVRDWFTQRGYDVQWDAQNGVTINGIPINMGGNAVTMVNDQYYAQAGWLETMENYIRNTTAGTYNNLGQGQGQGQGQGTGTDTDSEGLVIPPASNNPDGSSWTSNGTWLSDAQTDFYNMMKTLIESWGESDASPVLTWDEASQQAETRVNAEYDTLAKDLQAFLLNDAERRGIYASPLATKLTADKMGDLESSRVQAVFDLATQLQENSRSANFQERTLDLQSDAGLANILGTTMNWLTDTQYQGMNYDLAVQELNLKERQISGDEAYREWQMKHANDVSPYEQFQMAMAIWEATGEAPGVLEEMYPGVIATGQSMDSVSSEEWSPAQEFNAAMEVWKTKGVAPASSALAKFGINEGDPWIESNAEIIQGYEQQLLEQEMSGQYKTDAIENGIKFTLENPPNWARKRGKEEGELNRDTVDLAWSYAIGYASTTANDAIGAFNSDWKQFKKENNLDYWQKEQIRNGILWLFQNYDIKTYLDQFLDNALKNTGAIVNPAPEGSDTINDFQ